MIVEPSQNPKRNEAKTQTKDNPKANNFVDERVYEKLQQLQILPSELCTDEEFLRRAFIDTAGRLQNKRELMDELAKIRKVLGRLNPEAPHDVVLVLDATNGQNALNQIDVFKEVAGVTGLVMTKLDGTARGGVLVAAAEQYGRIRLGLEPTDTSRT